MSRAKWKAVIGIQSISLVVTQFSHRKEKLLVLKFLLNHMGGVYKVVGEGKSVSSVCRRRAGGRDDGGGVARAGKHGAGDQVLLPPLHHIL